MSGPFKMKAGQEGPMRKNFPSVFRDEKKGKDDPVLKGKVYDTVEVKDKAIKPGTFIGHHITGESTIAGSSERHHDLRTKLKNYKTKKGAPKPTGSELKELERLNIATSKAYMDQEVYKR